MNLIDGFVTKILEKKQFTAPEDWSAPGQIFDIFVVEYEDMGGTHQTELWFDADENKQIEIGYHFLH